MSFFLVKDIIKSKSKKINSHLIILSSVILFSVIYWFAALHKDFHVDEFYSWVYTERCTFEEIITLKDFGIGHLPLFHLIQKLIQTVFPNYLPFQVRFANYIFGLFFLITIIPLLLRRRYQPIFCFSISISGGVLNAFVFGRMWGLLCLLSTITLWRGEEYLINRTKKNLIFFLLIIPLGFFTDLNFILLIPYVFFVLIVKKFDLKKTFEITVLLLTFFWLFSILVNSFHAQNPLTFFFYKFGSNLAQISYEIYLMLFNWEVQEFIILSIIIIFLSTLFYFKKHSIRLNNQGGEDSIFIVLFLVFLLFILLQSFINLGLIRIRLILFVSFITVIYLYRYFKKSKRMQIISMDRIIPYSIITSILLLLSISPHFWRDLISSRFLIVLMPFILLLTIRILPTRILKTISILFLISGFQYSISNAVDDYFPPSVVNKGSLLIFQDEFAYSTQYLRSQNKNSINPYFLDNSSFLKFCRVCSMGTTIIPFQNFNEFYLIARNDSKVQSRIPSNFILSNKRLMNLNFLDRFFFRFLSPVHPFYYELYFYRKENFSDKLH